METAAATMTRLRARIKELGLRRVSIAQQLGVVPSAVTKLELNGIRSIRVARRYASILGCDPLELLE